MSGTYWDNYKWTMKGIKARGVWLGDWCRDLVGHVCIPSKIMTIEII